MDDNEIMVVNDNSTEAVLAYDYDNILSIAERADKMVKAMNKIMDAALKITTGRDWCLIGGMPYLQETGASKVARLFGISWRICDGYPKQEINNAGYPTFTYRMQFTLNGQTVECEGMRSAADEFFTGRNKKSPDEVDIADVKRSAYTNCLNRGIKTILPGLRNLDVTDLERAGIDIGKTGGYTFKTGTKGGKSEEEKADGLVCADCGAKISQKVASFSQGKYGRPLCMDCQKKPQAPAENDYPPFTDDDDPFRR